MQFWTLRSFLGGASGKKKKKKNPSANAGDSKDLGWEDPMKEVATTPVFLPDKSHGFVLPARGAWQAIVCGVTKSWT